MINIEKATKALEEANEMMKFAIKKMEEMEIELADYRYVLLQLKVRTSERDTEIITNVLNRKK
jgi:hypothetical protein